MTDGREPENFIAYLEPIYPRPDGFDHASDIMAQAARKPEPGKRLHLDQMLRRDLWRVLARG